jgi:hypothetical protein
MISVAVTLADGGDVGGGGIDDDIGGGDAGGRW